MKMVIYKCKRCRYCKWTVRLKPFKALDIKDDIQVTNCSKIITSFNRQVSNL